MMSVTSSVTPAMVENSCRVEPDLGHRRSRDGRQEGPAQRVAEGVAETGLEGADGEALPDLVGLAQGFDGRALDDEHVVSFGGGGAPLPATSSRARR
jgi:hypothetical protein